MKKDYLKPEQYISVFEVQTDMLEASYIEGGDQVGPSDSKDRGDFEGEGDSEWGALW